nr:hypothetical protein [Tanacetum cinerariifolium]
MPRFPGSGFYQNFPKYQQMHGFPKNPMLLVLQKNKKPNESDLLDDDKLRPFREKVTGSVFGKEKLLFGEDESGESNDESSESDKKGSESDEDAETTSVKNKNCKKDKF